MATQPFEVDTVWEVLDSGKIKRRIDINNKSGYRYCCMICGREDFVSGNSAGGHLVVHKERKTVPVTPIAKVIDEPHSRPNDYDDAAENAMRAVDMLVQELDLLVQENARLKGIIADMAGLVNLA